MIEYKAPHRVKSVATSGPLVFFAGSIEMGKAEDWQTKLKNLLVDTDYIILNPRRDDWGSSWEQSIHNQQFSEQVNWEIDHIDLSDIVIFYFDPNTKSPITLMELGYVLGGMGASGKHAIVCCPDGFWRKGNVDIMCQRDGITVVQTIEEIAHILKDDHETTKIA